SLLALFFFLADYPHGGRGWWLWGGLSCAAAVLAKGPVGLVLPGAVVFVFLFWERRLSRLADSRLLLGTAAFVAAAVPWYLWVGLETHGHWLYGFWQTHNQNRFLSPMENHGGPVFYYLVALLIGLAPWSPLLGLVGWHSVRALRDAPPPERPAA